jgi:UPF0755 protein
MKRLFLVVLVLIVIAAGAVAVRVYSHVRAPYRGYTGPEQFVEIPVGAGSRQIGDRLIAAGVIRDRSTFQIALWQSGQARHLQAGEYRFDRPATPAEVLARLARGDVYVIKVTFPEGRTIREMAAIFEGRGLGPASAFIDAARDTQLVRALDPGARDLEGYLFPETYSLPRRTTAPALVRAMVDGFQVALTPEMRESARARGLSIHDVVTLASIVEKETARPEERPLVAAVYENRLRIRMALQSDPTVIYALDRAGKYAGNLRRDDLSFDSPYNTYRYTGLPAGPIAAPGKAALDAVIHPAKADYLYFVSRNDGSHEFARTLTEHDRNVFRYQIQYFREQRARGANRPQTSGLRPQH